MSVNIRNRSLRTAQDTTRQEFAYLPDLAPDLKWNVAFDRAESRMHPTKALLVAALGN